MNSILGILKFILDKTDGWKAVIGYILLQIPFIAANPMLLGAIHKIIADPQNAAAWGELVAQVLLAVGILHKIFKNTKAAVNGK